MLRNPIEAVVGQLSARPTYLYGTPDELNAQADNAAFPCVFHYALSPLELSYRKSLSVDSKVSLYLEFLYQTPFAQYSADNEAIVLQALGMAQEFMVKLASYRPEADSPASAGRYFRVETGDKAQALPVYNKFDVNSTGVNLRIALRPMYAHLVHS